jgi:hypothetical protein
MSPRPDMLPIVVHDRFLVMYAYGGIYIDADIVLRQPILHLRNALSFEDGMKSSQVDVKACDQSMWLCFCWFAVFFFVLKNACKVLTGSNHFFVSLGSYDRYLAGR